MTKTETNPRRLPLSLAKPSAAGAASFFATRKARADFKAFDKLMNRRRSQPLPEGDEIPGPRKAIR